MTITTITVLLVDDHELIREGLRRALEREPDVDVVAEAASVAEALVFLFLVVLGALMSLLFPALGPVSLALTGGSLLLLTLGGNLYSWQVLKLDLPLTSSLLLILGLTLLNLIYGFFGASQQKARIKSIFDQYVPPAHIDEMLNHPDSVSLDGKRKEMSVLFSDIRGFTTLSEKLTASELKSLLNRYFSPITKTIFEHQGTIDKYVGDMVMAFWNAPPLACPMKKPVRRCSWSWSKKTRP